MQIFNTALIDKLYRRFRWSYLIYSLLATFKLFITVLLHPTITFDPYFITKRRNNLCMYLTQTNVESCPFNAMQRGSIMATVENGLPYVCPVRPFACCQGTHSFLVRQGLRCIIQDLLNLSVKK